MRKIMMINKIFIQIKQQYEKLQEELDDIEEKTQNINPE